MMDKKTYWAMTAIIAILCVMLGCFIGSRYMPKDKPTEFANKPEETKIEDKVLTVSDVVGEYSYEYEENNEQMKYSLLLYNDGSYKRVNTLIEPACGSYMAGKYQVVNNKIELEDVYYYECDACYHRKTSNQFSSSFNNMTATLENNTILLVEGVKTYNLNKISSEPGELINNLLTPENDESLKDCTNIEKK